MIDEESFEIAPQLWDRMSFWTDGHVPGFRGRDRAAVGPRSPEAVADLLFDDEARAKVAILADEHRTFVERLISEGPRDEPYNRRLDGGGSKIIYEMTFKKGLRFDCQAYFRAPSDAAALMAMLRHTTAKQAADPAMIDELWEVRVRRVEFAEINEFGQAFFGEAGTLFEWRLDKETPYDDHGRMLLDASALLWAAKLSVDPIFSPKE